MGHLSCKLCIKMFQPKKLCVTQATLVAESFGGYLKLQAAAAAP